MASTYTEISLRVVDLDAKAESVLAFDTFQPQTDMSEIKDTVYSIDPYNTLEHNSIVLDGACIIGDTAGKHLGGWTLVRSDSTGTFTTNPTLTITTTGYYFSSGFTMTFGGDGLAKQTTVRWYNDSTLLATKTDTVTNATHFVRQNVDNYNKIVIEFIGSWTPNRRIKLAEIDFGQILIWGKNNIIDANYIEEVNLTSSEVTVNELNFKLRDLDSDFNMLNPAGIYAYLRQNQQIFTTEYVDGVAQKISTTYLKEWESLTAVTARFKGVDIVGTFDTVQYKDSAMWSNATVSTIIGSIMSTAGFTDYTIDSGVSGVTLSGYIPISSVREALHFVCFAARMSLISNRDGSITFRRLPSTASNKTLDKDKKLGNTSKVKQKALINSVAVTGFSFAEGTTQESLYSATLATGTYEVKFDDPVRNISVSGANIVSSSINYVRFTVATAGTVNITGYRYLKREEAYVYEADGLTAATRIQAKVSAVYLVSPANALQVAQFVYDDKQNRIQQNFKLRLADETAGDNVNVNTMLDAWKSGTITKLDIDLTGGFLADCEVIG